jgi:hypothetical protein
MSMTGDKVNTFVSCMSNLEKCMEFFLLHFMFGSRFAWCRVRVSARRLS